ncbi:MAG: hypothetical protein U5Q03_04070 [Bacteroidota bacterium]|nr:hypothetical protein [Bacteroidota bacterium]
MKKLTVLTIITAIFCSTLNAQIISSKEEPSSSQSQQQRLRWGAYGEVKFTQPLSDKVRNNASLDVHRIVLLMGYQFSDRLNFVTEIEVEHVNEIYLEQAYLNYRFSEYFNIRGGLVLIPVGIVNEIHEPTTFNGVNRPIIDKKIIPSTWREIGFGITGNIPEASLKYQAYIVNGFLGYDGEGTIDAANGLRSARQKGARSVMSSPNFTGRISYYGLPGLEIGLSAFAGNSESTKFNGIKKGNDDALRSADSTVVGIALIAADLDYKLAGFGLRAQYVYGSLSNTLQYNTATGQDIGSSLYGYYAELSYNVLRLLNAGSADLRPFFRYARYNTQNSVETIIIANDQYDVTQLTFGIGYKITPEAVVKADYQLYKTAAMDDYKNYLNLGIGFAF